MLRRDMQLFILGIAAHLDHFHPVKERTRDCLGRICRCQKYHFRQIQRYFQIMIPKSPVLLLIQHFQKCGKCISFIVCTDFIDFIQKGSEDFLLRLFGSHWQSVRASPPHKFSGVRVSPPHPGFRPGRSLHTVSRSAFANERAIEVFPVPGGPARQSTGLPPLCVSARTARNSRTRSLTSSSP